MDKLKNLIKSDTPTEESTRHSEPVSHGTSGYPDTSSTAQSGTGVAAVGDTSTYSSSQLGRGDPTSSVIDSQSRDPLTYTKPESSNLASMPGHENPYRASSLDPRVDGGRKSDAPIISRPAETQEYGVSSHRGSSGTSTAPAPSSLTSTANPIDRSAEYGQSTSTHGLDNASSVIGTSSHPTASSTGPTSSTGTTGTTHTTEQPSVIGSALGAVGLGGLASSLGYGASQPEHTSTTSQPTTTTGVDSYTAPTHQGPSGHYRRESIPTSAYPAGVDSPRAINAPVGGTRASIDQGVQQTTSHSHSSTGVGAGVGAAALGSGIGLGREQERAQATRENITGEVPSTVSSSQHQGGSSAVPRDMYNESQTLRSNVVSGSGPTNTSSTLGHTSSTPGSTAHTPSGHSSGPTMVHNLITVGDDDVAPITSSGLRDPTVIGHGILHPEGSTGIPPYTSTRESRNLTSAPLSSTQESGKFTSTPLRDESHTGRNAALGGAAATAAGAGAYAAHEHRHGAGSSTTAPLSGTQESGKFTSTPLRDQGYASSATPLSGTTATTSVPSAQNTGKFTSAPLSGTQQSGKFTSTPLTGTQDSGKFTSTPIQEERHTGRDAALGGAAATAVGAGAYGAHQHKDQAEHQKELEKAEKAHQKEVEKEEKREQKELHKEEKAHQKELEKAHHHDEKAHQKELAAVGKRNEREEAKLEKDMEREKKPSIFKRIFKKRQNKETGAEEEYSTDEEDDHHHRGGVAGAGVAGGATGAAIAHDRSTTGRPTEPITGLPYDPSKDPSTARHLSEHSHGQGMARSVGATDTNDLREDRLIGGSGGNVIDPIAAGSFKMGVIEDGKHGSVSHDDRSGGYSTGTGTGVGSGIGSGVGTGAAAHGLGQQHDYSSTTGTAGTGSQTLPYRPTNAAPGDSTQHYTPNVGNEGRRLSTAETYGSPTTSNIRAPGNEPQHLAAQEMQHVHQTGEHETVGTQLKDSFKFGGL